MKKTTVLLTIALALVFTFAAVIPAQAGPDDLARLTLKNKTDGVVYLQLMGPTAATYYYLTVPANEEITFTVERMFYDRQTFACGLVSQGVVDIPHDFKMTFVACDRQAPNQGEPSQEKISLFDSPTGQEWYYQDF